MQQGSTENPYCGVEIGIEGVSLPKSIATCHKANPVQGGFNGQWEKSLSEAFFWFLNPNDVTRPDG